jgi:hypothetical protein
LISSGLILEQSVFQREYRPLEVITGQNIEISSEQNAVLEGLSLRIASKEGRKKMGQSRSQPMR